MIAVSTTPRHLPVLPGPVTDLLAPAALRGTAARVIDGTVGLGGHAALLLQALGPQARLLALDQDPVNLDRAAERLAPFADRVLLRWSNFDRLAEVAREADFAPVQAILLDLGVSSPHLDDPERGFSFLHDGPLDMRMDPAADVQASHLVNHLSEERLADLIYQYGEERHSRRIARAIVARRPLHRTLELADAILSVMPRGGDAIHPATRTFQALRIAVNNELDVLRAVLPQAVGLLAPGGRLGVIAFHSLEDRIVKEYFRTEAADCICPPRQPVCTCKHTPRVRLVTRKAVQASDDEIAGNPRARSARFRVVERR